MGNTYTRPEVETVWYDEEVKKLPSMAGKAVAVTGCTTGLGLVCAKTCAAKGATVYMLNRPSERAAAAQKAVSEAAAAGGSAVHVHCDLQDFDSVRSAAADVSRKVGSRGLDVLCNNAGVMALPDKATSDGYDVQMKTNHLSHFLLTRDLMPALNAAAERAGSARIVNHSSGARKAPTTDLAEKYLGKNGGSLGGDGTIARFERYHQTKLANAVFTSALQDRLDAGKSKVKAAVAVPGAAASNLQSTTAESGGSFGMQFVMRLAQSVEDGALPLLHCCCAEEVEKGVVITPNGGGVVGWLMGDGLWGPAMARPLEPICTKQASKDLLWRASEAAVGTFTI